MLDIEVLRLALSKEEDAIKTYKRMLISNTGLRDMLDFLITEEQKHKALIEKRIAELML